MSVGVRVTEWVERAMTREQDRLVVKIRTKKEE